MLPQVAKTQWCFVRQAPSKYSRYTAADPNWETKRPDGVTPGP